MFSAACVQQAKKQDLEQYHRLHLGSITVETEDIFLFCTFLETFKVLDFSTQNKESKGWASWLHAGFVKVFLLIRATVNYIQLSTPLLMSVWGLQALSWNSSPGHASEQMAVRRSGAHSLVCPNAKALWAWNWSRVSQSPDSCSRRQPCHWKVIPQLGADVWFVLPAVSPSLFSPGR